MDPTARLLRLIGLLQARPEWSSEDLADRLGVTPRTVRRDVARLRDLGYAVDAAPGRLGGYRLARGQALPPLVLTDDEAVSVAVGLRTAAVSGVVGLDEAAVTALTKLEQALPSRLRARLTALGADTVHLFGGQAEGAVDAETLAVLALACRRGERVLIGYRDAHGNESRRDVDPYRVVRTASRWYLVARDVRKDAWRTLRIDRVTDVLPVGARVRLPDAPDALAMVAEAVATGAYAWTVTVRLHLPIDEARARVSPTTGLVEADGAEATLLRLGANELDWVAHYLAGLACGFDVLDPPDLVAALHRLGDRLRAVDPVPAGSG